MRDSTHLGFQQIPLPSPLSVRPRARNRAPASRRGDAARAVRQYPHGGLRRDPSRRTMGVRKTAPCTGDAGCLRRGAAPRSRGQIRPCGPTGRRRRRYRGVCTGFSEPYETCKTNPPRPPLARSKTAKCPEMSHSNRKCKTNPIGNVTAGRHARSWATLRGLPAVPRKTMEPRRHEDREAPPASPTPAGGVENAEMSQNVPKCPTHHRKRKTNPNLGGLGNPEALPARPADHGQLTTDH